MRTTVCSSLGVLCNFVLSDLAPKGSPTLKNIRDEKEIFESLGQYGDHEALAVLFNRFGQASYNLAYFILGSTETAQEAVEEAMLQVVQTAPEMGAFGDPLSWILRVTARHCIRISKRRPGKYGTQIDFPLPPQSPRRSPKISHEESGSTIEPV